MDKTSEFLFAYRHRLGEQLVDQIGRIEQARERIKLGGQALNSGLFASQPPEVAANANQRIGAMGNALDQILNLFQNQAVADITEVMQQHQGLRQFQYDLARRQLFGEGNSANTADHGVVIEGEAAQCNEAEAAAKQKSKPGMG